MLIHSLQKLQRIGALPLTTSDMKLYLKIEHQLEDVLLQDMIAAATDSFERYTSTAITQQIWEVVYKKIDVIEIELPIRPVMKIIDVMHVDLNYQLQHINKYKLVDCILVIDPIPTCQFLTIRFQAGQDSWPTSEAIKLALMEHIAFLYENRETNKNFDINKYARFCNIKL